MRQFFSKEPPSRFFSACLAFGAGLGLVLGTVNLLSWVMPAVSAFFAVGAFACYLATSALFAVKFHHMNASSKAAQTTAAPPPSTACDIGSVLGLSRIPAQSAAFKGAAARAANDSAPETRANGSGAAKPSAPYLQKN